MIESDWEEAIHFSNSEGYADGYKRGATDGKVKAIKEYQRRLLEKTYCARQDCDGCPYDTYKDCTSNVKIISVHIEDINDIAEDMLKENNE